MVNRHSRLGKGSDTMSKADILAEYKKRRLANQEQHPHDPVDTPGEVDAFIPGKRGPIDSPIEVERDERIDHVKTPAPRGPQR